MMTIRIAACLFAISLLVSCSSQTKHTTQNVPQAKTPTTADFRTQLQRREAAGETPPSAPDDPGYAIVNCDNLTTAAREIADRSGGLLVLPGLGLGAGRLICGNTTGGRSLLLNRKWKCGELADRKCVCGRWIDGVPFFTDPLGPLVEDGSVTVRTNSMGDVVISRCVIPDAQATSPITTTPASPSATTDLMQQPGVLLSKAFSRGAVSVAGIRLGDPEAAIPREQITEKNSEGWRHLESGARFRIKDGLVVEMGIPASRAKDLGLGSDRDIRRAFGEPGSIERLAIGDLVLALQYHYPDRGLVVNWIPRLGGLAHITVYAEGECGGFACK